jgi:enediyne biosynthesis protein E3
MGGTLLTRARMALLGVSHEEATAFSKGDAANWRHLEQAVLTAVGGYHAVLEGGSLDDIVARLDRTPLALRSYAYEGAAMGFTGMDCFLPWKSRFREYAKGPGAPHIYQVHIGAGEALARLRRKPEPFLNRLGDPVLRWLVMDGYGFHEGFFKPKRYVTGQEVPLHLSPYARRVFDQGIGRSIWFLTGAQVDAIAAVISAFPAARQPDLWLGIGVACGYVGGVRRADIERLREAAGPCRDRLAVGAAFVAKGRQRAGNPVPDTDLACEVLCGMTSAQAARLMEDAFASLPVRSPEPGYELLQRRLLATFAERPVPTDGGGQRWT